jgi:hypothetical protein
MHVDVTSYLLEFPKKGISPDTFVSLNGKLLSSVFRRVSFAMHLKPHLVEKYLTARESMRRLAEYLHLD